jgi:hypothetical protein
MPDSHLTDYYEILQVSPRADNQTIERVFRLLAKRYHPDNQETGDTDRFTELANAYHVLSDPERRAKYDVSYDRIREAHWRIFDQDSTMNEVAIDARIRLAILSLLYIARRTSPNEPGLGPVEIERVLSLPQNAIGFHFWYLRENSWVERLQTGHLAITAPGVDRLFDLGGPTKAGPRLLKTPSGNERLEE